ncbi:MAG TPA: putative Na+/H+ antiporter [Opitutaceae bacterium]|nr:putative Na+/H+ antiporter [Opitutaceae bacterium]
MLAASLFSYSTIFAAATIPDGDPFPRPLNSYGAEVGSVWDVLVARATAEPFNLVATGIFLLAILHTFLAPKIRHLSHVVEERHAARRTDSDKNGEPDEVSFLGQVLHFFGEIEAVFGIWVIALIAAMLSLKGADTAVHYLGHTVNFTEPMFVVIIMALASTRPVLQLAESCLQLLAGLGGGKPWAWWLTILIVAPLLGSFITEPAAMTIAAMLLAKRFYALNPSPRLKYATLGLLFVNISVGGTLTHFAAPPVLMVAGPWKWDMAYMLSHFGWKAVVGIVLATTTYFLFFRKELLSLSEATRTEPVEKAVRRVPAWIIGVHLLFLAFTVIFVHYPAIFIGGFLFFLAFAQATAHHQNSIELRSPLLVGFFLAGLVIHGGLQGWWIEPVLKSLGEAPLFWGATVLTAFNDNAAITYLATLVPGFSDELKYAVVAGAVTGGGLTVIANAPNPAGQSILQRFFSHAVSPLSLVLGALIPTLILAACFLLL